MGDELTFLLILFFVDLYLNNRNRKMKKKEFKLDGWSAWIDAYMNNENYDASGEYVLSDEDKKLVKQDKTINERGSVLPEPHDVVISKV